MSPASHGCPTKTENFVSARTLFEFSTAGLRGCVTGAVVRRSSERNPGVNSLTLSCLVSFPPPFASLPLALPSPMARGVDPQQSSLGYIQVRTEITTRSVLDRQWNDAEAYSSCSLIRRTIRIARVSFNRFVRFSIAFRGSRWMAPSLDDHLRWCDVVPGFVNVSRFGWTLNFDALRVTKVHRYRVVSVRGESTRVLPVLSHGVDGATDVACYIWYTQDFLLVVLFA